MSMSPMELEEIQDKVRGMSQEQLQGALTMVPYKMMVDELTYRYERLLNHYARNAEEVAAMVDILPQ